jgi:malate dehydrogenase (oxaloacetate-decarboxylating)
MRDPAFAPSGRAASASATDRAPSGHRAAGPPPALEAPRGGLLVGRRGADLLSHPLLNKGAAFPERERAAFGLRGLLPPHVATIDEQVALELEHVRRKSDDLERFIGLAALQDRNETLFYRLLVENLEEFLPVVYTPTVGRACQEFSHIFRRPRGVWISPADVGRIPTILAGAAEDVRLIVVTDNERILGLGDQGAGGMAIPVGKLALYSAVAGIHPTRTLPVSLDVGTDRADLLSDPYYLGYRAARLHGEAYDDVVQAFVEGVRVVFPHAVVQWEDFKQHNALRILARFRHRLPSFNDDIQGTAAVVLGGLLAARRADGGLGGDRFMFLGAGAAALGIAELLGERLRHDGVDESAIRRAVVMADSHGLVHVGRTDLDADKVPFAVDAATVAEWELSPSELADPAALARAFGATVLIGTTGTADTFREPLIRQLAANHGRPVILPLSNPSSRAEARPEDLLAWTDGRAIVATGSPFPPVALGRRRVVIGQANNVFVFPGIGLGAIVAEVGELTSELFLVAASELADQVTAERLRSGAIYPPVADLRAVTRAIAIAVIRRARDAGFGRRYRDEELETAVDRAMWWPDYLPYEPIPHRPRWSTRSTR